jgi:hypothetical protein
MAQRQIDIIKQGIQELNDFFMSHGANAFSDEVKLAYAQLLDQASNRIVELRGQLEPTPKEVIPQGADLLWILAGNKPEIFMEYLKTVPDPALNNLLNQKSLLESVIATLQQKMPEGEPPVLDGIEKAPINSSNIYGFNYDPKTGRLLVRFQEGGIYQYEGVSPFIYRIFQNGAVPAKTSGKNKYGQWWEGKNPSLGAAFMLS